MHVHTKYSYVYHCSPTSTDPIFFPLLFFELLLSNLEGEKAFKSIVELMPIVVIRLGLELTLEI